MTVDEAKVSGYTLIVASPMEVGLLKNGKGIRTWWNAEFHGRFPDLDHPLVQQAILVTEEMEKERLL